MLPRNMLFSSPVYRRFGASMHNLTTKSTSQFTKRRFTSSIFRSQEQQQKQQQSSYRSGMSAFRPFGAPFLKVFLGAIFTYQVIYYVWMKLETSEKKLLRNKEIKRLEEQARELAAKAK